jgi:hypothetical protein
MAIAVRARISPTLEQRVTELEQRVRTLEQQFAARFGPRDLADRAVLPAIVMATQGAVFTSRELLRHARVDGALHQALEDADVTTTQECGQLLHRLEAWPLDGVRLERVDRTPAGRRWRVVVCR